MYGEMEFVTYDKFKNLEFIAEGGFSKIYKAIWEDGPITSWNREKFKYNRTTEIKLCLLVFGGRNKVLEPLLKQAEKENTFDKVLFFNDIIWKVSDILTVRLSF
ncbi:hypothetical protein RhiirA1_476470 [Rhizophagus irregularis]|uniref:Protein kinase domain-containing protein n=1 Tax=Rhizophagus irregularis TaxID=588596 RepID=A0A2N0QV08_9GLOM|nr:hypothetical protein RhiirA1_476470 [Rhizophagus irregularis]